jgi:hypothetical protein
MVAVRLSQQEQLYHCHGRATNATATGPLNVNNCTPDCANGTNVQYPIQMSASNPQHCNVAVYKQYSSVSQQKKAYVFNKIQLKALSGNPHPISWALRRLFHRFVALASTCFRSNSTIDISVCQPCSVCGDK